MKHTAWCWDLQKKCNILTLSIKEINLSLITGKEIPGYKNLCEYIP